MANPAVLTISNPSSLATYGDLYLRLLDGVLLLDPTSFCVLEVNPACERVLGVPPEKLLGRSLTQWVDAPRHNDLEKAFRVAMRRYHPRGFEIRWKTPSAKVLTMEVLACPLTLGNGKNILQLILKDVSFRREAELKLQITLCELKAANEKLERLTKVDELTGLFNFRHLKNELEMTHSRAARENRPYSAIFCDIDHFKNFNDRNGHPAGDQLLREFAGLIQKSCRIVDIVARYGGEEFLVILPSTDLPGAMVLAERLRGIVENRKFRFGEVQPAGKVTMSIGVATFPHHGLEPDSLIQAADEALYVSKAKGRNRVTIATELPPAEKKAAA